MQEVSLTAPAMIGCGHVSGLRSAALPHAAGRYGDKQTRRKSKLRALSSVTLNAFPGLDLSDQFAPTVPRPPSSPTDQRKRLPIRPTPGNPVVGRGRCHQIHAARLMAYDAALKIDRGEDARIEVSMIKVFTAELAWKIVDQAMQTFGAMGMTKELPLQLMANRVRLMRIYEGPTEVHRWVIARKLLGPR